MSDGKVRLGVIGLGWWGQELARVVKRTELAEVVSCFARGEAGRRAFAAEHHCRAPSSLEEFLGDPELHGVLIATSHQSHRPLIESAAAAGKHIFVEKPLTTTFADGRASVDAANAAGVLLQVGHQRRRTAANRRIKAMLEAGEIGDIEAVVANQSIPNGFTMPDEAWRWNPDQSPLGSMTSLGIHKIDSMQYLAGPIRSVSTFTRQGRTRPIDEVTVLALEFESGALGTLTTSFFTPLVNEISIFGMDAAAYNMDAGARLLVQKREETEREEVELEAVDPVADQLTEFARAIRGEAKVEATGEVGLAAIAVMEAAVQSAESGQATQVEYDSE